MSLSDVVLSSCTTVRFGGGGAGFTAGSDRRCACPRRDATALFFGVCDSSRFEQTFYPDTVPELTFLCVLEVVHDLE